MRGSGPLDPRACGIIPAMPPAPAGGRWERLEQIFLAAADLPQERNLFLDRTCADDAALRAEVEAMLAEDSASSTAFLGGLVEQVAADGSISKPRPQERLPVLPNRVFHGAVPP